MTERKKKNFNYIQKVAISWNQQGIKTLEQARNEASRYNNEVKTILKALGMNSTPTDKEISYINVWREELGFSLDIILEACDRTVIYTETGRLRYCDGILRKWRDKKVSNKSDIARLDATRSKVCNKKALSAKSTSDIEKNNYCQIKQDSVDFVELESLLLEN